MNGAFLLSSNLERLPVGVVLWNPQGRGLVANAAARKWLRLRGGQVPDVHAFWQRYVLPSGPVGRSGHGQLAFHPRTRVAYTLDTVHNLAGEAVAQACYLEVKGQEVQEAQGAAPPRLEGAGGVLGILRFVEGTLAGHAGVPGTWPDLSPLLGRDLSTVLRHLRRESEYGFFPRHRAAQLSASPQESYWVVVAERHPTEEWDAQRLLASAAHEMRNPLSTVRGFLQLLPAASPEDQVRYVAIALREVDRITRMVHDFLEPPGEVAASREAPVDWRAPLRDALLTLQEIARERQVELLASTPSSPVWVPIASSRLEQLVRNLVENAVQAAPSPGGHVWVHLEEEGEWACLTVDDDGPGIPEDLRETIFQPFFTQRQGGHGLGLSIAQRIVHQSHGRIAVGASPAGGARFHVQLPRVQEEMPSHPASPSSGPPPSSPPPAAAPKPSVG